MKKILGFAALLMIAGAVYVAADTTFSWSGPQATGTLTYDSLNLTNPSFTGAVSMANVTITTKLTAKSIVASNSTTTVFQFCNVPTDPSALIVGQLYNSNGIVKIKE